MNSRFLFSFFTFLLLFFVFTAESQAENMRSNSYYLQFGNFNISAGEKTGANYQLTDTVGGMAVGPYGSYGSSNYFIGSGFQYIYQLDTFSFDISKLSINFGELFYGAFSTDSHTLTITTDGASGYAIYAFENHPLRAETSFTDIPNTSCDVICTGASAGSWTNANNAGFGFNMSGDDIASDFINSNYFRPFANNEASEAMQEIMGSTSVALDRVSTVTYQASMPANQAAGNYQTSIVFVAVPGY